MDPMAFPMVLGTYQSLDGATQWRPLYQPGMLAYRELLTELVLGTFPPCLCPAKRILAPCFYKGAVSMKKLKA